MIEASIVIATYNRSAQLRECLEALVHQTQPAADFEVVVVVDGSTDDTVSMLSSLQTPYSLRFIDQENAKQPTALNRGAEAAQGRVCIFIDDDIIVVPEFVAEHIQLHQTCEQVVGIGQIKVNLPPNTDWFAREFRQSWNAHYNALNEGTRMPTWDDCYGGNMSVLRRHFLKVGGNALDLRRGYDIDLAFRLEQSGLSFIYLPKALGIQLEQKRFRELTRDSEQAGTASVQLYQKHPATLPRLIGGFAGQKLSTVVLWRFLLWLRLSVPTLERFRRLLGQRAESPTWYRFIQGYAFWCGVRQALPDRDTWKRLTGGVPILMYHAVGMEGASASRFVIPVKQFERQMAWLKKQGYHVLDLEAYLQLRLDHRLPPARSVIITFDDGYLDNVTLAVPILQRYGFPATIFLVSNSIGGTQDWDQMSELAGRPLVSWENLRNLLGQAATIRPGAHTCTHPPLTTLNPEQAREEISGSKVKLEEKLGTTVQVFSYPYGDCNAAVQELARQAGFLGSCSVATGLNTVATPLHALRRVEVYGTDSLIDFAIAIYCGDRIKSLRRRLRYLVGESLHRRPIPSQENPDTTSSTLHSNS